MSASRTAPRLSRSPNGCNAKPIWLATAPEERREIEQLAKKEQRSVSAMSRILVLKGLAAYRQEEPSS